MRPHWAGLCDHCEHRRRVVTDRGSEFLLCAAASEDPRLPRYPRLPILSCPGFRPGTPPADENGRAGAPGDL
jgi:hypothetical protein